MQTTEKEYIDFMLNDVVKNEVCRKMHIKALNFEGQHFFKYQKYEYKYFKPSVTGTIHFSSPNTFNDISESKVELDVNESAFELLYVLFKLFKEGLISKSDYEHLYTELRESTFETPLVVACFLADNRPDAFERYIQLRNEAHTAYEEITSFFNSDNPYLVTCFSKRSNSDIMWAYYGDKHFGYCVEYNFDKMFVDLICRHECNEAYLSGMLKVSLSIVDSLHEVTYTDKPITVKAEKLIKNYIEDKESLFSSQHIKKLRRKKQYQALKCKKTDWSKEKEVRMIIDPENTALELDKDYNIIIPSSLIAGVYAGQRSVNRVKKHAEAFKIKSLHCKVSNINLSGNTAFDELPF